MILGGFTAFTYILGRFVEQQANAYSHRHNVNLSSDIIRHRIYTLSTFGVFNFFFIFAGYPLILFTSQYCQ